MKTYLTKHDIENNVGIANQYFTKERLQIIKDLSKKYNIEFTHTRQMNLNLFWQKMINEIDALPNGDPFLRSISARGLQWDRKDHNSGVELPLVATVHHYMESKRYDYDYNFLKKFETWDIEQWLNRIYDRHKIRIKIEELYEAQPDFESFFNKFGKSNADKQAIKRTEKIFKIIEDMFQGELRTIYHILPTIHNLLCKEQSNEDIFDEIHNKIHKNED